MNTSLAPQITPHLICSALKTENGFFSGLELVPDSVGEFVTLILE